jgi:hypothetical protein
MSHLRREAMNKEQLLSDLYEVLYLIENEAAFELIGNAIDFVKNT